MEMVQVNKQNSNMEDDLYVRNFINNIPSEQKNVKLPALEKRKASD